jgi:hypothetical protein
VSHFNQQQQPVAASLHTNMQLAPSQEPEAPAPPPAGGRMARSRSQTRRSRVVEETQMQETLPTGDEMDIRQVRHVNEGQKVLAGSI